MTPEDKKKKREKYSCCLDKCVQRLNNLRAEWTLVFEEKIVDSSQQQINHLKMVELNEKIEYEQDIHAMIFNAIKALDVVVLIQISA